ncbi:MAG: tetratricopeptide repeat protein [Bryobacteraceae bacterium]|nr:tetratricopeptide repeat protein [Bryobacteraceae bacterium]
MAEHNRRGSEYLQKGDNAGALAEFEAAAKLLPDDPAIQFNVGLAMFRLGRYRDALGPLGRSLGHGASASQARYLRGVVFFQFAAFDSCAREIESLRGDAGYGEHVLYMLVESYRNAGDAKRSQEAFVELGARYPDSAYLHKLMGMAHEWQNNESKAIEEFQAALRVNPRMPEMAFAVGYIYFKQQNYEQAAAWFAKELALDPCYAKAHHYLGEIDFAHEKIEQAAERYRKAIQCDPELGDPYLGLGSVHERNGELEPAVKLFREAAKRKPDDMQAHYKLGLALRRLGRRQESEAAFAAARKIHERELRTKKIPPPAPSAR